MKRIFKIFKYTMITLLLITVLFSLIAILYMRQPQFGLTASGERLERIKKSKNYRDGAFTNLSYTPNLTEGYSMTGVMYDFLFKKIPRQKPPKAIPHVKTDLKGLPA